MTFTSIVTKHFFPLSRVAIEAAQTGGIDDIPHYNDERKPDRFLRGNVCLAAVLLDAAGIRTTDFQSGVITIQAHRVLRDPIERLIEIASGAEIVTNLGARAKIPDIYVVDHKFDESATIAALQTGCVIVGIGDTDAYLPEGLADVSDNRWTLPVITCAHIEAAIALMTGDTVTLPAADYLITDVLKALRPGVASSKVAQDLIALTDPVSADVVEMPDTSISLGDAAADVVTRLRDLSGYGDAKAWGLQLASDLCDYLSGKLAWADVDKGLLLSGPPGCGKTYFAKALAAECDVKLIVSSYSDWEAATGSGNLISKSIKKIFADARKCAPCIVFIDEIDTVGSRGAMGHNNSWFSSIVNTLLAELDGAEGRDGVVVIGATNHPENVDPALLRPGRLDRHVMIPRPSIADLAGVLRHHVGALDGLDRAARACRGLSPADIAQVAREARRVARWCKRTICADDVLDVLKMRRGIVDPALDRQTCVHEAGHALVAAKLGIHIESVDADARLCQTAALSGSPTLADVQRHLVISMGGRNAEKIVYGVPSHGCTDDLAQATGIAFGAIARAGLTGTLITLPSDLALSQPGIRSQVEELLHEASDAAYTICHDHRHVLDRLVDVLIERRYLDSAEVAEIIASTPRPTRVRTDDDDVAPCPAM